MTNSDRLWIDLAEKTFNAIFCSEINPSWASTRTATSPFPILTPSLSVWLRACSCATVVENVAGTIAFVLVWLSKMTITFISFREHTNVVGLPGSRLSALISDNCHFAMSRIWDSFLKPFSSRLFVQSERRRKRN
jgi:hypothetical protein